MYNKIDTVVVVVVVVRRRRLVVTIIVPGNFYRIPSTTAVTVHLQASMVGMRIIILV